METMTRRQIAALSALAAAVFLVAVDGTVLAVAVPSLAEDLQPSYTQILWISDIYSFMLAGLLVTAGNLGDRVGRKRLLMFGVVGFGAMSVVAAYAPSAELLIAARAVQGIAGAALMPSTLALIRAVFTESRQRTLAVGIWSSTGSAGAAIGSICPLLHSPSWGSSHWCSRSKSWLGVAGRRPRHGWRWPSGCRCWPLSCSGSVACRCHC